MFRFKRRRIFLAVVALMLAVGCAAAETTARLTVEGFDAKTEKHGGGRVERPVMASFKEANPDVKLTLTSGISNRSTRKLLSALKDKSLKADVFLVDSSMHDPRAILSSGYCLDLTDNPDIAAMLALMHPSITEAAQVDGRVYGVPVGLNTTRQLYYLERGWAAAGLTAEDAPTSYTGLLDFLETWAARMKTDPVSVCVTGDFDGVAKPTTYTAWLLEILLRGYANQCGAAGVAPDFGDPTLKALMERTRAVGEQLYELREWETRPECGGLFTVLTDVPQHTLRLVPTRLTDDDPLVISATVTMACVNANRSNTEAAQRFIAHYVQWIHDHTPDAYGILEDFKGYDNFTHDDYFAELNKGLLFADATGPIHSLNPHALKSVPDMIQHYQALLDGDIEHLPASSVRAIPKTEEQRQKVQSDLEYMRSPAFYEERYRVALDFTEEELAKYQELAPYLTFLPSSGFDAGSSAVAKLLTRYASGALTVDELVTKLNEQIGR